MRRAQTCAMLCAAVVVPAHRGACAGLAKVDVAGTLPPPLRIPMAQMGFQAPGGEFLLKGNTGLTVDFVDNDHLLVSFNARGLIQRAADAQPDDDDRMVDAVLLELPTGKVLARTEWRLHDNLQYIWNLGHGRFLLRVRDKLTLLAPMDRITTGDAFRGTPVLNVGANGLDRHIVWLGISSDHDLLTLETTRQEKAAAGADNRVSFSGDESSGVQINFYRLDAVQEGFRAEPAGMVTARAALEVPMTRAGILDILSGGNYRWLFNFNEHAGKVNELAEWDTSCFPRATFVSHSEFVAFGCRGSTATPEIAGFNLKGEQMWEQGLYEDFVSPHYAFAPAAGRFVLERMLLNGEIDSDLGLTGEMVGGEEVRVYKTETGGILLKVNVRPVERAGGNFALSPDGMRLAAFDQSAERKTSRLGDVYMEIATDLVVYPLPPLSEKERTQIREMEAKAPADTGARIDASLMRTSREQQEAADNGPRATVPVPAAEGLPASLGTAEAATVKLSGESNDDKEPENPAITGELPNAPGAQAHSGGDGEESAAKRRLPTLYQPGEASQPAPEKKVE